MTMAVEIKNLSKIYDTKKAVDSISLNIKEGTLLSLLGVNGAGKTTTIKMLSGLTEISNGEAYILGKSVKNDLEDVKKLINISPQDTAVAPNLTVKENLEFIAEIYNCDDKEEMKNIVNKFSLDEVLNIKAKTLSGGWQRRLSIAMALITKPKVLFLDEPTLGLDVIARRELWKIISSLKGKITIILTTHYMEEAQNLCSRVALMDHGKLEEVNTPAGLIDSLGNYTVDEFAGDETHSHYFHSREEAIAYLSGLSGQASLRETTLEDVFVERAGRHLMPS